MLFQNYNRDNHCMQSLFCKSVYEASLPCYWGTITNVAIKNCGELCPQSIFSYRSQPRYLYPSRNAFCLWECLIYTADNQIHLHQYLAFRTKSCWMLCTAYYIFRKLCYWITDGILKRFYADNKSDIISYTIQDLTNFSSIFHFKM